MMKIFNPVFVEKIIEQNICYLTENDNKLVPYLKDTLDK